MQNNNNSALNKFLTPTSVAVSKDRRYLLIFLPNDQIVRKPINYFRAIIENVEKKETTEIAQEGVA